MLFHSRILSRLPDFTHTRLRLARIGNRPFYHPNWRLLHTEMVYRFLQRRSGDALDGLGLTGVVMGRTDDPAYAYHRSYDVSIKTMIGANRAARNIGRLAAAAGLSLSVGFIRPHRRERIEQIQLA